MFKIAPHFRLQEWVAEEKDYFRDEALDYIFQETVQSTEGGVHDKGDRIGAFQSFEQGRKCDISCACHWTVDIAAARDHEPVEDVEHRRISPDGRQQDRYAAGRDHSVEIDPREDRRLPLPDPPVCRLQVRRDPDPGTPARCRRAPAGLGGDGRMQFGQAARRHGEVRPFDRPW